MDGRKWVMAISGSRRVVMVYQYLRLMENEERKCEVKKKL